MSWFCYCILLSPFELLVLGIIESFYFVLIFCFLIAFWFMVFRLLSPVFWFLLLAFVSFSVCFFFVCALHFSCFFVCFHFFLLSKYFCSPTPPTSTYSLFVSSLTTILHTLLARIAIRTSLRHAGLDRSTDSWIREDPTAAWPLTTWMVSLAFDMSGKRSNLPSVGYVRVPRPNLPILRRYPHKRTLLIVPPPAPSFLPYPPPLPSFPTPPPPVSMVKLISNNSTAHNDNKEFCLSWLTFIVNINKYMCLYHWSSTISTTSHNTLYFLITWKAMLFITLCENIIAEYGVSRSH